MKWLAKQTIKKVEIVWNVYLYGNCGNHLVVMTTKLSEEACRN